VLAALALALSACGGDDPAGTNNNTREIRMQATAFSPSDVTIARGLTVRWVNDQAIAHTITPSNLQQAGVWATQNIPATQGANFSHAFNTAGVFNYTCTLHVGMTGRITVQ
jgi:plastocyanin